MAIEFEFTMDDDFHFSTAFAEQFKVRTEHDRVWLPEYLGDGFIQEVPLDHGLSLCMHTYTLKQTFVLRRKRSDAKTASDFLTLKFPCRNIITASNDKKYPASAEDGSIKE